MDYEGFDIGNFEDELCSKICKALKDKPKTANELSAEILGDEHYVHNISEKLQKLKRMLMVGNIKVENNICFWGLEKKYRLGITSFVRHY